MAHILISDLNMDGGTLAQSVLNLQIVEALAVVGGQSLQAETLLIGPPGSNFDPPSPDDICQLRPPSFFNPDL